MLGAGVTYHHTKFFLHNLVESLDLKSAAFVFDKDGFYLLLVNKDNKAKEVRFGSDDEDSDMDDVLLTEVKELVASQGW